MSAKYKNKNVENFELLLLKIKLQKSILQRYLVIKYYRLDVRP